MTPRPRRWWPLLVAAAALSPSLSPNGRAFTPQVFEKVLVKVNGDLLTRRQLDERVRSVLAQEHGRAIAPEDMRTDPVRQQASALAPRLLADAIDEVLIIQRARELGFDVEESDVDRVVARMRLENNITTNDEFEGLLRTQGIQPDALRDSVRNQIFIEQVRQQVFRRVTVSDQDARGYYLAQPMEFAAGPAVVFREILVALPPLDDTRTSAAVAREYDQGLIRLVAGQHRVSEGEDFAAVALSVSEAPSKDAGGLVGPIDPQALPEPMRAALARLSAGGVSAPIRTEQGYWLLKLESVSAPQPPRFETLRARVLEVLLARKQASALAAQLKRLRAGAVIEWKDQALKAAFQTLETGRGGGR